MLYDEWNAAISLHKNSNNFHRNQVKENVSYSRASRFHPYDPPLSIFYRPLYNLSPSLFDCLLRILVKRIPSNEEKEIPGSPQMVTNETKHMIKYVEIPYTSWTGRRQFSFKNQRSGLRSDFNSG